MFILINITITVRGQNLQKQTFHGQKILKGGKMKPFDDGKCRYIKIKRTFFITQRKQFAYDLRIYIFIIYIRNFFPHRLYISVKLYVPSVLSPTSPLPRLSF